MNPETANIALQFMQRVNLQGGEVTAWQSVVDALTAVRAQGAPDMSLVPGDVVTGDNTPAA